MRQPAFLIPLAALALAGCGKPDRDQGNGGVTRSEAKALDEAAEMLDAQRLPPSAAASPSATAPAAKP